MARKRRVIRAVGRRASDAHVALFRRTGGRRGGRANGVPVLLLTTTGRMTGLPRTRPVGYLRDGDDFVVCGSNGGSDHAPAWPLNLRANPLAQVDLGSGTLTVRAVEATGDEGERRWQQLVAAYPVFAKYRRKTTRRIPMWVIERAAPAP